MALLQISEPGQSPDPHGRRLAVGIDLGTANVLVYVQGKGIVIQEPSVVAVSEDNRIVAVGEEARDVAPLQDRQVGGRAEVLHDPLGHPQDVLTEGGPVLHLGA